MSGKIRICRLIRPAKPQGVVDIYTQFTKRTTTLGLIMVATIINKFWGWQVEVIDEGNYRGPRGIDGLPDHKTLQKECPADVVGFYCGLTSTMERVWELAAFYKSQGAITLGGSWHAHYCPEETLRHDIDLVFHGDAEMVIKKAFANIESGRLLHQGIGGVSYLDGGAVRHVFPDLQDAGQIPDCDGKIVFLENKLTSAEMNQLPYPDFGLLKYAKIRIYPIGRIRGCSMGCKFCTVKTDPHWSEAEWLFGFVDWLVKTRKARSFFLVDDRSEEDLAGTIKFFNMVAQRYGRKLRFTVQIRLPAAKNIELLSTMRRAGVRAACIGLESPIEEELSVMGKGLKAGKMLEYLKIWRRYMKVHGMLIFGFPASGSGQQISIKERARIFKRFIKKAKLDFLQITLPIPLPGSAFRNELLRDGRLYPLDVAPLNRYDGSFVLIKPDKGVNLVELQNAPVKIMAWFYSPAHFYKMVYRTVILPVDYFLRGWDAWHSDWVREVILWVGHNIVKRWRGTRESEKHLEALRQHGS